jgi:L-aspartate oxidase
MSEGAGVMRSESSLRKTMQTLQELSKLTSNQPRIEAWEASNLHLLATAIVRSALERTETRGSHWRSDFPSLSDQWEVRVIEKIDTDGNWHKRVEQIK